MKAIVRQLVLLAFCWNIAVDGYPMIVEVDEEEKRVSDSSFCMVCIMPTCILAIALIPALVSRLPVLQPKRPGG